MFKEPVVYVDIETTGGSYRTSQIIEFAAIRVKNDEIVETFSTLINPGSPIPYHITNLTGITTNDVMHAPKFGDVAQQIFSILSGAIFIAHHVRFDYSFIKRQLEINNIHFNPKMLCSVRLSRALYPMERGHGLEAIINRFNIPVNARHRAYDDAEAVIKFLKIARDQHGQEAFEQAARKQLRHLSLPPNLETGALDAIPNTPGVYTFADESGLPIYIGKSVTLRKRILSHFSQDTKIDKEMKLSLNTHKISFIETGNELEALLLESQMVKEQLPLYNRQLRRTKKMYILKSEQDANGYQTVKLDYIDTDQLSADRSIYGVYASKMKARGGLENLQKMFDLCPKLLGLEKSSGACFKYQLHKCKGACAGVEPTEVYNTRFETAFERNKIDEWPYSNPIVVEHSNSSTPDKKLVIDNWNVIGELTQAGPGDGSFKPWKSVFDIDTYKIIRSYLAHKSTDLKLQPITYKELDILSNQNAYVYY